MSDELPFAKPAAKEKRRKRLKSTSAKRRQRLALYHLIKTAYIVGLGNGQKLDDPLCERCNKRVGQQIHHMQGREGNNLFNPSTLALLCDPCHDWIHDHSEEARQEAWMRSRN